MSKNVYIYEKERSKRMKNEQGWRRRRRFWRIVEAPMAADLWRRRHADGPTFIMGHYHLFRPICPAIVGLFGPGYPPYYTSLFLAFFFCSLLKKHITFRDEIGWLSLVLPAQTPTLVHLRAWVKLLDCFVFTCVYWTSRNTGMLYFKDLDYPFPIVYLSISSETFNNKEDLFLIKIILSSPLTPPSFYLANNIS